MYHALIGAGVSVSFHHVLYPRSPPEEILAEGEDPEDLQTAILPRSREVGLSDLDYEDVSIETISAACGARTPRALGIIEVTQCPLRFVKVEFMAYGNQAELATHYGTICMIATMKGYDVDEPWTKELRFRRDN